MFLFVALVLSLVPVYVIHFFYIFYFSNYLQISGGGLISSLICFHEHLKHKKFETAVLKVFNIIYHANKELF